MKVCIFTRSIFKLGGTKRVITMVANEMAKEGKISLPRNYIGRRAEIEIAESPCETLDIRETERNGKAD